jgi:hypothetical protein
MVDKAVIDSGGRSLADPEADSDTCRYKGGLSFQ